MDPIAPADAKALDSALTAPSTTTNAAPVTAGAPDTGETGASGVNGLRGRLGPLGLVLAGGSRCSSGRPWPSG